MENDWLSGYVGAILEKGVVVLDADNKDKVDVPNIEGESGTVIRYFVNEATGFSEVQLHRTWLKATAMKNVNDRGSRLENFCWRIWYLSRKKKQLELEEQQRRAERRQEKEEAEQDVLQEVEDEEGGKEDDAASHRWDESLSWSANVEAAKNIPISRGAGPVGGLVPAGAVPERKDQDVPSSVDDRKLYIVMLSVHGLVRGENMELGRDSDTGGQVKYVVELARALATIPQVYRVDLLTRQVVAEGVDWSYGEPAEMLSVRQYENKGGGQACGESAGAYIVRIPCGPRDQYTRKERLWPYMDEFADAALAHIVHLSKVLADQVGRKGERVWPYMIHGHYADAGDVAALLSGALNVPMVLTGHSLGRNKLEQLLAQGRTTREQIEEQYSMTRRIQAEEFCLDASELVVTSTRQEVEDQWGLYDGFDVRLERVLRARQLKGVSSHGRYMPRMAVIPPGMDFSSVVVPEIVTEEEEEEEGGSSTHGGTADDPPIWAQICKFFTNPHKPIILALARPDPKKNLTTLIKAYGENQQLRDLANLTLVMGNRDDIDAMASSNAEVLTTVLKLIDKYDLYGLVAYPKHHKQKDVPEIYALAAKSKGVFVNPALVEPFGLTLIEAAAHGLPMVATQNGGPVDIQKMLSNGLIVDPNDASALSSALLQLLSDRNMWMACRQSALANIHKYSWPQHCASLLARVAQCRLRHPHWRAEALFDAVSGAGAQVDDGLLSASLKNIREMSLRLSVDGKYWGAGSLEFSSQDILISSMTRQQGASSDQSIPSSSSAESAGAWDKTEPLISAGDSSGVGFSSAGRRLGTEGVGGGSRLRAMHEEDERSTAKSASPSQEGQSAPPEKASFGEGMRLRRRRRLLLVALDDYDAMGRPGASFVHVLRAALEVAAKHNTGSLRKQHVWGMGPGGEIGVGVLTALTGRETVAVLTAAGIPLRLMDFVVAGSGSELYYSVPNATSLSLQQEGLQVPGSGRETGLEDRHGWQLLPDPDYFTHIEYRWSSDGLRRTMPRVLGATAAGASPAGGSKIRNNHIQQQQQQQLAWQRSLLEDDSRCTSRRVAYRVLDSSHMIPLTELRRRLRLRGLRCHPVLCRAATCLYLLPLHASRSQAMRYLFVRWGIDVADMAVILGRTPSTDSDFSQLLSGTHRTFMLQGETSPENASATELPNLMNLNTADGLEEGIAAALVAVSFA